MVCPAELEDFDRASSFFFVENIAKHNDIVRDKFFDGIAADPAVFVYAFGGENRGRPQFFERIADSEEYAPDSPSVGDNIEMRFPGFQQGIYGVVRLVKQEGGVTFVGCELGPTQAVPESDTTPKPDTSLQRLSRCLNY